ncbi:MAG: creatininase family protein [Burkholderiales bacterium]|nr:creatininase family protein [Burkholderiales bacterium]
MRSSLLPVCACVALAAVPCAALADATSTVFLEELTSPELGERIRAGTTTVLIPIGGTEQNGPHMVLGKHNVRARVLAGKIARALGNAVVAPVIAYVPESAGHMRYPGTIDVPADAYRKVLAAAARSLKAAGFRDIVFLGDSGDYQKDNAAVARELDREWAATGARAHAVADYYRAATTGFAAALERQGYTAAEVGVHAGLADTSLALAADPRLVRADRLQAAAPGVTGDPRKASAALGNAGVDAIVMQSVSAIRAAVAAH